MSLIKIKYWPWVILNWFVGSATSRRLVLEGKLITYKYIILPHIGRVHEFKWEDNCRTFNADRTDYELVVRRLQIELYDFK